jgi:hypothetical protein
MTQPKFNHNSMIKRSTAEKFSCFPTAEEEGTNKFPEIGENEDEDANPEKFPSICSINTNQNNPFAAWQPFIPKEHVYQNSPAQLWW